VAVLASGRPVGGGYIRGLQDRLRDLRTSGRWSASLRSSGSVDGCARL